MISLLNITGGVLVALSHVQLSFETVKNVFDLWLYLNQTQTQPIKPKHTTVLSSNWQIMVSICVNGCECEHLMPLSR